MRNLKKSELPVLKNSSRSINQYTISGVFVKQWEKQSEISKALSFNAGAIGRVCKGERSHAYNFIWRYSEDVA
jgi:hypothetical protein